VNEQERSLREVIAGMRSKHGLFPERVSDIPDFPYSDYVSLRTAIETQKVILQRFASEYGSSIFALFATDGERAYLKFISLVGIAGPLLGIVLAFTVRWYWIIPGILTPFLVMREHKKLYNGVILRGALSSELGFCFLYRIKQIALTAPDYRSSFYWQHEG
jgi:hypothetical protein